MRSVPTRFTSTGLLLCVAALAGACTSAGGARGAESGPSSRFPSVATPASTELTSADPTSFASTSRGMESSGMASSATTSSAQLSGTPTSSGGTDRSLAARTLAGMSPAQRVGQLIMVDCPSTDIAMATTIAIRRYHVGSIILDGNTSQGMRRTRALTTRLQSLAPERTGLFVATDQEGGEVQRLQGPGFARIPDATRQGTWAPATVRSDWARWGDQLARAGVDVDLAPVLDTVPAGSAGNPPIGDLDREYGRTPAAVTAGGTAALTGLAKAGVDATAKHFPGLGRVAGNTDTTARVTDQVTTRHDAYLRPFAAAVRRGVPFVMMSTAIYRRIDPRHPAAFSPTIVTGMLRHQLGFRGIIISDDIGSAAQVRSYPVGRRAVMFVGAGGTMALTVDPSTVAPMISALLTRSRRDPAFAAQIDAAALLVLQAKQARGLLG